MQNASTSASAFSLYGLLTATAPAGNDAAVRGQNSATGAYGFGVWGSQAGAGVGVYGTAVSGGGMGVYGYHAGSSGTGPGVEGRSASKYGAGVLGYNSAGGPALQALVTSNAIAPLKVNSTALVVNLNANYLGGHASSYFLSTTGTAANSSTLNGFGSTVFSRRAVPAAIADGPRDTTGDVGQYTSATIGSDGLGLISYYDATNGHLKVLHCSNVACTSGTVTRLDNSTDNVGKWSSIAIGSDGLGLISYFDASTLALKVAHCSNVACTSATTTTLDPSSVGGYTSVTISGDGYGLISYYSTYDGGSLKVAHCSNLTCTSATTSVVDDGASVRSVGLYTSITTDGVGTGLISYYDLTNGNLKVAACNNYSCSSSSTATVDASADDVGRWTSITVGADGKGLISYEDVTTGGIEVAQCQGNACSSIGTPSIVASGSHSSITIGGDGLPELVWYSPTGGSIGIGHCVDAGCSNLAESVTSSSGQFGEYPSVTTGTDGFPLISFYDGYSADLWTYHCPNLYCTSYFRRR